MPFAHDTQCALAWTAALVNSVPGGAGAAPGRRTDALLDAAALDAFVTRWPFTGSRSGDAEELAAVRALRSRLRALWTSELEAVVELVNALLREGGALPQLVRHDGWDHHVHATPPEAPLAARMAVEAAMAMTDVVRVRELDRLRVCAATGCDDVLVDLSKNRSRRFCDVSCANRTNVAAFRARRAGR